jgi:hypothetical protein
MLGQFDPAHQLHDFNPGIKSFPSGLFWVIPISCDSVEVHLGEATALISVEDIDLEDYHDVINALKDGPEVASTALFSLRWSDILDLFELRDETHRFRGRFIQDTALVFWSAENEDGLVFTTDPGAPQTNLFWLIGHERNGVFF